MKASLATARQHPRQRLFAALPTGPRRRRPGYVDTMTVMDTTTTSTTLTTDEQRVIDLTTELLESFPPKDTAPAEFLGQQFDRGLAWVHFPEGNGGLGLNPKLQTADQRAGLRRWRSERDVSQPDRARDDRPHRRRVGERGAEAALPAAAVHGRGDLVPAVLRARVGLRLRRPVLDRRAATATNGSATVRRSGPLSPICRSGVCSLCAPIRKPSSTPVSPRSSSTCMTRPSRSDPSGR